MSFHESVFQSQRLQWCHLDEAWDLEMGTYGKGTTKYILNPLLYFRRNPDTLLGWRLDWTVSSTFTQSWDFKPQHDPYYLIPAHQVLFLLLWPSPFLSRIFAIGSQLSFHHPSLILSNPTLQMTINTWF